MISLLLPVYGRVSQSEPARQSNVELEREKASRLSDRMNQKEEVDGMQACLSQKDELDLATCVRAQSASNHPSLRRADLAWPD